MMSDGLSLAPPPKHVLRRPWAPWVAHAYNRAPVQVNGDLWTCFKRDDACIISWKNGLPFCGAMTLAIVRVAEDNNRRIISLREIRWTNIVAPLLLWLVGLQIWFRVRYIVQYYVRYHQIITLGLDRFRDKSVRLSSENLYGESRIKLTQHTNRTYSKYLDFGNTQISNQNSNKFSIKIQQHCHIHLKIKTASSVWEFRKISTVWLATTVPTSLAPLGCCSSLFLVFCWQACRVKQQTPICQICRLRSDFSFLPTCCVRMVFLLLQHLQCSCPLGIHRISPLDPFDAPYWSMTS